MNYTNDILEGKNRSKSGKNPRYSIGQVSQLTGVSQSTLRYWEQLGLILPQRSAGNTRFYSLSLLDQVHMLRSLIRENRFKARDVAVLRA